MLFSGKIHNTLAFFLLCFVLSDCFHPYEKGRLGKVSRNSVHPCGVSVRVDSSLLSVLPGSILCGCPTGPYTSNLFGLQTLLKKMLSEALSSSNYLNLLSPP